MLPRWPLAHIPSLCKVSKDSFSPGHTLVKHRAGRLAAFFGQGALGSDSATILNAPPCSGTWPSVTCSVAE